MTPDAEEEDTPSHNRKPVACAPTRAADAFTKRCDEAGAEANGKTVRDGPKAASYGEPEEGESLDGA